MVEPELSNTDRSPDPVLIARDLHVTYSVYEERYRGVRHVVARPKQRRVATRVRAVQGVSLSCHRGEIVGVLGKNGSGKSSLLQALAGSLPPTTGVVLASSQPTLLGVGSALNRTLSGRRNIVIGLLALGFSRTDAHAQSDAIIEFAGLSDAIERPLKTYSTGMRARLQFAIATAIRPDILLIDEILSVGDNEFKQRSNERIRDLQGKSGCVVIVSHNISELEYTCTRLVWLHEGRIRAVGSSQEVADEYRNHIGRR